MAKKKKAKRKIKQPTKAELEAARKRYDEELAEEKKLLAELDSIEASVRHDIKAGHPQVPGAKVFLALVRMFKRKHLEASELRSHLVGIKDFLVQCWDEEEEYFDPSYARDFDRPVTGHWCPNMIEEIEEITQEDTVYSPLPIGSVF